MAQSNVETMHEIYGAFAKGDVPTVLAAFSPEIVWTEFDAPGSPWGGDHHGHNGVVQDIFMQIMNLFEDVAVIPEEILDAGDKVLTLGRFRAKAKATGKSFDTPFAHVATFSDGKITKIQIFEDSGSIVNALA